MNISVVFVRIFSCWTIDINSRWYFINNVTVWDMYGTLPLESCSSPLHKLYRWRVVHSHLHFGHTCWYGRESRKGNSRNTQTKKKRKPWEPTDDTFLRWRWNDAALQWRLDWQLLMKAQEVTVTPPHGEGFTPEHGQGWLQAQKRTSH